MSTTGIKFLYQFSVGELNPSNPGSNILSVTSAAVGHDKKNLTSTPLRETWRSTSATTPQEIVIQANDLTVVPDVFVLLNHNFSENAVVTLKCSTTNNFVSPALTIPFIYNPKHMILSQGLGVAYQYYKITILDPGNPCGYIEIGKIIGGLSFTFDSNEDMSDAFTVTPTDLAYSMKSEGFFRASTETVTTDDYTISFDQISTKNGENANYLGLRTMTSFVRTTLPFFTIIDPSDVYFEFVWGQLVQIPPRTYSVNRYATMSMEIMEVY